ncbi:hypothetical protein [Enterococcus mundtii]|uniref:Uncharacterized protein n=2 Tax=Enterococcus mundtii TaxID=53346 RepID=A0A1I4K8T1_ENTMU|nr:hypothetical protein [Enterococcus mundtii]ONN40082.1 hypothetical protein BTN92_15835 [Enterococcus mundtii]SFL75090.1 hypothetical protein SAMN04487758_102235 [Enterococcus mundtii]
MATKKTYTAEITCDVCKKKEIIHEGESRSFLSVSCAVREIGYRDEYGNFHEENTKTLLVKDLDLCPECREKAYEKIITRISQMFSLDYYYSFFSNEEQEEIQ